MDPTDALRRELSSNDSRPTGNQRQRQPRGREFRTTGSKPKRPTASPRASAVAQHWYNLGEAEGFAFPYDVNYFALALQKKVEGDKEIQPFLLAGKFEQVERWLTKMVDLWWSPVDSDSNGGYLTNEITQRNAKDYFLDTDWDDLRDYARSCLRAAYLVEHHRPAPKPIYLNQQEYNARLEEIRTRYQMDRWHKDMDENPPTDREPIDPEAKQRLRSWVSKRRKK